MYSANYYLLTICSLLIFHLILSFSKVHAYVGFSIMCLDTSSTSIKLVDEHGNRWNCTIQFVPCNDARFLICSGWNKMVKARGLKDGDRVVIGAPGVGSNETLYCIVIRR